MDTTPQTPLEKYVSLTTSFIAVALSISSIFANAVGDELIISRSVANNEWSYFQSKSIKQNLFEANQKVLETQLSDSTLGRLHRQKIEVQIKDFQDEINRYEKEKDEIKANAKKHEKICQIADKQGSFLDLSEAFYQISIILSAISLIARSRILWVSSIFLGIAGISTTLYVYFSI